MNNSISKSKQDYYNSIMEEDLTDSKMDTALLNDSPFNISNI